MLHEDLKKCIDKKYPTIIIYNNCNKQLILECKKYNKSIISISYRKLTARNFKIVYCIDIKYLNPYIKLDLNNYIKNLYYLINNNIYVFDNIKYNVSTKFIIELFNNVSIENDKIELKIMIDNYNNFNIYTKYIIENIIKLKYNRHIIDYILSITTNCFIYTGIFEKS